MRHLSRLPAAACLLVVWLGYFTALQWSVVRYRLGIVAVLTSAAVLLAVALLRRWRLTSLPRSALAGALLVAAVVAEAVPFFSYAAPGERRFLAHVVAVASVLAAGSLAIRGPRGRIACTAVAMLGAITFSALAIRLDKAPAIDVWVILQQASDGLARGDNLYTMTWQGSPGIQDAFTYLPWTAVLLAPGRLLAGDVRWALLVVLLIGLACLLALGASRHERVRAPSSLALGAAALLALAPGSVTQAEQAWTEPLLFACLAGWALLVQRGRLWWAVVPLALGCASKQHLALLLPVLACWAPFGLRRTAATGGLAGLLVLPWFLAAPADMWHDAVSLLVSFHPIRFANTWFIAARTELGWTPPFWLTGLVVLVVLVTACVMVRRRHPPLAELLGWLALLLLAANLVNKQAFYNQYWLVGALVALALAATQHESPPEPSAPENDRGRPAQPMVRETG